MYHFKNNIAQSHGLIIMQDILELLGDGVQNIRLFGFDKDKLYS